MNLSKVVVQNLGVTFEDDKFFLLPLEVHLEPESQRCVDFLRDTTGRNVW